MKPSLLFVCWGNICRSPLAHGVMYELNKKADVFGNIDSCGMYGEPEGEPIHEGSQSILRNKLHSNFTKRSRHWKKSDYNNFDLILAMDSSNYRDIMDELGGKDPKHKVRMFRDFDPQGNGDVPDPYYSGGFGKVFDIINRTCANMIDLQQNQRLLTDASE